MRVVLLVDDKPNRSKPVVAAQLNATRELGNDIMRLFAEPRAHFSTALYQFDQRYAGNMPVTQATIIELAYHYLWMRVPLRGEGHIH